MSIAQRANLARLALYLEGLPSGYIHFDMESYFHDPRAALLTERDEMAHSINLRHPIQGMCGCGLGHSAAAGIVPDLTLHMDWKDFAGDMYGVYDTNFDYLFGGEWWVEDNTAMGTASRIREYLGRRENHIADRVLEAA